MLFAEISIQRMLGRRLIWRKTKMVVLFCSVAVLQTYLICSRCNSFSSYFRVAAFTFLIWLLLWEGNNALAHYLDRRISWISAPGKRFGVGLLAIIAYTVLSVYLLIWSFQTFLNFDFGNTLQVTFITATSLTIVVTMFLHSKTFLFHWKSSVLEAEKFQRESITSRYESLKSRVNPQMLFTSLQTLGSLVHDDKEKAVRFIKQLSEVYRYILDSRDKNVVEGDRELKFLRSFFFLQNVRFGSAVQLSIAERSTDFLVSPLSIQIIIETVLDNAVFDHHHPIRVKVEVQQSAIVVLADDVRWADEGIKTKLTDIMQSVSDRYTLLSDGRVTYAVQDNCFRCSIPLIFEESGEDVKILESQRLPS